jgi:soluble lytic murein transglycosylase
MKEKLLLTSFSMLLLTSPGILSQPVSHQKEIDSQHGLLLASVDPGTINTDAGAAVTLEKFSATERVEGVDKDKANAGTIIRIEAAASPDSKQTRYSDTELAHMRQLFLKAETLIKTGKDAEYFLLADQLKDYPLYPYLQYQWLKDNLGKESQVKHYLRQHASSRYAPLLKRKWLHHLGKQKQWPLFIENFQATSDTILNCYFHTAQLETGDRQAGLDGAKKLWVVGKSQPDECDPLFSQLKDSKQLTQDLLWQRFDAALQNNKVSFAAYIKKLMPKQHHATAILWINLHNRPSHYLPQLLDKPESTQGSKMFSHAIKRLSRTDAVAAAELWDANKNHFDIDKTTIAKVEKKLAFNLAFEGESSAYDRFGQLSAPDKSSRQWRVRVAIADQNWPNVIEAIDGLSDTEKSSERWQYWLARAYLETGDVELAQSILLTLSDQRSFYGYLAADRVDRLYQLSASPVDVSEQEIVSLKNRDDFRVAFEFMVLDRTNDAKLQWWHAVRHLDSEDILTAAKLAQRWQWDEIAIFTVAKAKHWDDIELRFPMSYADKIHENSRLQKLNPAILFGLVRRESAFNEKAYSPAGARGLMQIMPNTGKQIAKNLNERWRGSNSLYDPVINLKYGSYYYQKLLNQFDGNYAIALAAYNAGPDRVKKWLPENETIPADVWIETIPYKETREYVTNVLAYALIYQQRVQSVTLSMNDLTQDVSPL